MKKNKLNYLSIKSISLSIVAVLLAFNLSHVSAQYYVAEHGQLKVDGNRIKDQNGEPIQLRGMSLYWSQWNSDESQKKNKFYTSETVKWLRDDWKCSVVRAAMGVEDTLGYYIDSTQEDQVTTVVDAAIQHGIYVIIDYHSHLAHENIELAKKFFSKMAKRYAGKPNVIYETYNEPITEDWSVVKAYHEEIIAVIREYDKENLILCAAPFYAQYIDKPANDPIADENVAYTLHYYAAAHDFRDQLRSALDKGIAVFISEYGTAHYDGDGTPNEAKSKEWWSFLDEHNIGSCNWSLHDWEEAASALKLGASPDGGWADDELTVSGNLVREYLRSRAVNDPITATKNINGKNAISIAPNPFATTFTIWEENNFTYSMINSLGEVVLSGNGNKNVDVNTNIAPGVYTLAIKTDDTLKTVKVVKQ